MDIELRPLSLGEVLDRTFHLYRARFTTFFGIATMAAAIEMIWKLVQVTISKRLQSQGASPLVVSGFSLGSAFIALGVTVIALSVVMAAMSRAVSSIYLGQETGIAKAYSEVRSRWFRFVRLNMTAFLIAWSPVLLIGIVLVVVAVAFTRAKAFSPAFSTMLALVPLVLIFFLAIPVCVWLTLRYSLANPACVFEDLNVRQSLKRSVFLSQAMRGKIFVLPLITSVLNTTLASVLVMPTLIFLIKTPGHVPLWVSIYTVIVGFITSSLTSPLYGIGFTLFYFDARIRKEGFDVELMLERSIEGSATEAVPSNLPSGEIGLNL